MVQGNQSAMIRKKTRRKKKRRVRKAIFLVGKVKSKKKRKMIKMMGNFRRINAM